jgi:hypothetical protein
MQSLKNLQMCNYYLLRIINFINNRKNKQVPIENNVSDLLFLQKKRKSEQYFLNYQLNCITPKKEVDFSLLKQMDIKSETNAFSSEPNGLSNYDSSSKLSFDYNIEKKKSQYKRLNDIEYLIKKIINLNNENQKINLKKDDLEIHGTNKFFKNDKIDSGKNTDLSKFKNSNRKNNNLFKVMNINSNGNDIIENNYGKKDKEDINKRSEVKIMINNKLVYSNSSRNNLYQYSNKYKKSKKIIFIDVGRRRSKYRGVSKNGNQWQVLIMINKSKSYVGTYATEDFAARVYDILAIKNRGNKAKTNFLYSESQINKICNTDIDIKSKNLKEIISELLKEN